MASREPDFIIVKRDLAYERIPQLVTKCVTGFGESPEWKELDYDLPGVVLGALRRFLLRLGSEAEVSPTQAHTNSLSLGFAFIEELAANDDSELRNAVVNEIFEPLEPRTTATRRFYAMLDTRARELYRECCIEP